MCGVSERILLTRGVTGERAMIKDLLELLRGYFSERALAGYTSQLSLPFTECLLFTQQALIEHLLWAKPWTWPWAIAMDTTARKPCPPKSAGTDALLILL